MQESRQAAVQTGACAGKRIWKDHLPFLSQFFKLLLCFFLYFQFTILLISGLHSLRRVKAPDIFVNGLSVAWCASLVVPFLLLAAARAVKHISAKEISHSIGQMLKSGSILAYIAYLAILYFLQNKVFFGDAGLFYSLEETLFSAHTTASNFFRNWLMISIDQQFVVTMFFYLVAPILAHIITNITLNRSAAMKTKTVS